MKNLRTGLVLAMRMRSKVMVRVLLIAGLALLCSSPSGFAQERSGLRVTTTLGVFVPVTGISTPGIDEAELAAAPLVGVRLQRTVHKGLSLRGNLDVALGTRARVQVREDRCRSINREDACEEKGPWAVIAFVGADLLLDAGRFYFAAGPSGRFFRSQEKGCDLIDVACIESGRFPEQRESLALHSAGGFQISSWKGRDFRLEVGTFISREQANTINELTIALDVKW